MRYIAHTYYGEKIHVEVKQTPKTITIEMLEHPKETTGPENPLKNENIIRIRLHTRGKEKVTRDCVKDWGDGSFTVYFSRGGIPTYFVPE